MATIHGISRTPQPSLRVPSTTSPSWAEASDTNRNFVYFREFNCCWLCGFDIQSELQVAHHLSASDRESFMTFRDRGTIDPLITHLAHPGNLILLCNRCHGLYDAPIPKWLMVPANEVLQQMIHQEDRDYVYRQAQALEGVSLRRTLLQIDPKSVPYNAFILHGAIYQYIGSKYFASPWPRSYHGDVSAVFHRALTGALHPWGTRDIQVDGNTVRVGIPSSTQSLLSELAIKYGRKDPDVKFLHHPPDGGDHGQSGSYGNEGSSTGRGGNNTDPDTGGGDGSGMMGHTQESGDFHQCGDTLSKFHVPLITTSIRGTRVAGHGAEHLEKPEVSSMTTASSVPSEKSMDMQPFVFGPEFSAEDIVRQAMGFRPKNLEM